MIDLHMHTTASDGELDPTTLVGQVYAAGIRTFSITDHDTMAGVVEAAQAAAGYGMALLPGIEITAVDNGRDVHILGYFLEPTPLGLDDFLKSQRADRLRRAREISKKLSSLGRPIDVDDTIAVAEEAGKSIGRPMLAQALVNAGHVSTVQEAFDRWLGDDGEAYVARTGAVPVDVVRRVSRAGGVAALAHPGLLRKDDLVPELVEAGLGAIEVYHNDHDSGDQAHYLRLADQHGLDVCGGSDFHSDRSHRARRLGKIGLPRERFVSLLERVLLARTAAHNGMESSRREQ